MTTADGLASVERSTVRSEANSERILRPAKLGGGDESLSILGMNTYQTALQSFSIESLIGGERTASCPADRAARPAEAHYRRRRMQDSSTISPLYPWPSAVTLQCRDAAGVDYRHRYRTSSLSDTAVQQQQQMAGSPPTLPPPMGFDYLKVLHFQSAAAAAAAAAAAVGKPFSPLSLWPYLGDVVAFPPVPPNSPPPSPPTFGRLGDADADDAEERTTMPSNARGSVKVGHLWSAGRLQFRRPGDDDNDDNHGGVDGDDDDDDGDGDENDDDAATTGDNNDPPPESLFGQY